MSHRTFEIHFHHVGHSLSNGYSIIYSQGQCVDKAMDKAWEDLYRFYTNLENEPRPEVTLVKEVV